MTKKQVNAYIWEWQEILRLDEWEVLVKSNETNVVRDEGDDVAASARTEFNEARCYLHVARDYPDDELKSYIRHELLHLSLAEMRNLLEKAIEAMGPEAAKLFEELMLTAEERTVYRLDRALTKILEKQTIDADKMPKRRAKKKT